jgi:hypothetical protein
MVIDQIIASGSIIETATGTKEILMTYQIPAITIFFVALTTLVCLGVFYLFFKAIWSD